jgi:hypothetical protein
MEPISFSETSVVFYRAIRRYIPQDYFPEDRILCFEDLNSYKLVNQFYVKKFLTEKVIIVQLLKKFADV